LIASIVGLQPRRFLDITGIPDITAGAAYRLYPERQGQKVAPPDR
jgi:hypothetical protein